MTAYDVAIIGAGITGLSAAALLATEGKKVIVLERRPDVGGRLAEVTVDGYTLQWGGHILEDTGSGLGKVFEAVGLTFEDTGIRNDACPVFYDGRWNDIRDYYKDDKEEYRRIVSEIVATPWEELDKLDDVPLRTWLEQRTSAKGIIDFMESLAKIESMGGDHWWDISASDFLFTRKLHYGERRVAGYSVWPKGGFVKMCRDLRGVVERHGGVVETGVRVSSVDIQDGKVKGVTLGRGALPLAEEGEVETQSQYDADMATIAAEHVICTLPVWDALRVLPEAQIPKWYVDQINESAKLENRTFWFGFYAALEAPVFTQSPLELTGWVKGPHTGLDGWSFLPSALDSTVAPPGKHLLCCGIVTDPMKSQDKDWMRQKFDQLDAEMDTFFPDLKDKVIWKKRHKVLTYNTWQRPGLVGIYRPSNKVPAVEGLWVAGDTYRSRMIGIDRSARSAITVAEGVLGKRLPIFQDTWRY
ncbi:MAG TPA: NAD(P)/FAD-dependent oxidoreductase [Allosphingosinicella sp.]|jgi:phytoene dehydrogenase-like protein